MEQNKSMMKNIYGESNSGLQPDVTEIKSDVTEFMTVTTMIEFDMDDPNLTLHSVISRTKNLINSISTSKDDMWIGVYLVSGEKESRHQFWNDYFDYIASNQFQVKYFYRGKLHYENLGFVLHSQSSSTPCVFIMDGSELVFDSRKLFELLGLLTTNREIYQKFTNRFFDFYRKFTYISIDDFTELSIIGLKFNLC